MTTTPTDINGTSQGQCSAHLTIRGEDFRCDLALDHNGWAHSNKAAEAIWSPVPRHVDEPMLVSGIRRDIERTPSERGGTVRHTPGTTGYGAGGCPGDNLVIAWDDLARAARGES